jgi:hypothetical protein
MYWLLCAGSSVLAHLGARPAAQQRKINLVC